MLQSKTIMAYLLQNNYKYKLDIMKISMFFVLICCNIQVLKAQVPTERVNPLPQFLRDSIKLDEPSVSPDSFPVPRLSPTVSTMDSIDFSKDSLDAPVKYTAQDSMILDAKEQIVHLYGNAVVSYQDFTLKANYIQFDMENKLVIAEGLPDSTGRVVGIPEFDDKSQSFTAKKIKYNFDTQKGIVYSITTQQQGGYIRGGKAKIKIGVTDSTGQEIQDEFYSSDAIFTTCDHEIPHYGIRSTKQKFIPNKMVIIGPSNLEIMGIPTPLWLPFGFFPINVEKSSGLLFPADYEFSESWGYGLRGIGWYFNINDYMDLKLTGDIYTRGSWGLNAASNYRKRYNYSGQFSLGYSVRKFGDPETPDFSQQNAFSVRWSHRQDPKAHPSQTFSASVNFQNNNYERTVFNDAQSVLTTQYNSSVSYNKRWPGKPFRLSASMSHAQNVSTGVVNVTLPQLDFQVDRIQPFERKSKTGPDRWYEKLGFTYSFQARNTVTAQDSTLFTRKTLNDAQYGMKHTLPFGTTFKLFKYLNVSPNVNYSEKWYFNTIRRNLNTETIVQVDTTFDSSGEILSITSDTTYGTVETDTVQGFRALREFNAGISISTQIFGTMNNINVGRLKALRHVVKPSVSWSYRPDYTSSFWGYFDEVQLDTRYPDELQRYTIFENGIYGSPSSTGESNAIGFSINNILEAKVIDKTDTTGALKKVRLIDNFTLNGSYNLAADSLNFSTINFSLNTRLFKKVTMSLRAVFDPYAANTQTNARINTFEWTQNRRLARMTSAGLSLSTSLRWKEIQDLLAGNPEDDTDLDINKQRQQNSSLAIIDNVRLGYEFRVQQRYQDGVDTLQISAHSISLNGTINLTDKWRIVVGRVGYDFVNKSITYPDFRLSRDLHCWDMGFSWQPSRGTYSFYIKVRQSPLDFLKIPYNRNNYDPFLF